MFVIRCMSVNVTRYETSDCNDMNRLSLRSSILCATMLSNFHCTPPSNYFLIVASKTTCNRYQRCKFVDVLATYSKRKFVVDYD